MRNTARQEMIEAPVSVDLQANVLCVTADVRLADLLGHELHSVAPGVKFEALPDVGEALRRLEEKLGHDAVLIDMELPGDDALKLIGAIRGLHLPLAVVLLVGTRQEHPPLSALEGGADDYFVKRAGQVVSLCEILQHAIERRRAEHELILNPLNTLVVGDFDEIARNIGHIPFIRLAQAPRGPDGVPEALHGEAGQPFPFDMVLIDDSVTVPRALQALKGVRLEAPDVPVVMLMAPESGDAAVQASKLGASECIIKAGNHYHLLVPVLTQLIHFRNLWRELKRLKTTETHLRILIETVPVSVTVLAGTGNVMALNRAGLPLFGAHSPEQVVGTNIGSFVPSDQQRKLLAFVEGICAGREGTIRFDCTGLDGLARRLELRAVPLWREVEQSVTVLGVLRDASVGQGIPESATPETAPQESTADFEGAGCEEAIRAELDSVREELKIARAHLAAQREESRSHRMRAEQEFLEMEQRQRSLQAELESAQLRVQELTGSLEASRGEIERVKREEGERASTLQASLNAHFEGLARVEQERRVEREKIEAERQELADRCQMLESALASAEVGLAGQVQEFQARLSSSERAVSESEVRVAEWQELVTEQARKLEEVERERDALAAKLAESESRLAETLAEQLERAEAAESLARELEEKNVKLGATLRQLESQSADTNQEVRKWQLQLAEAREEFEKEQSLRTALEVSLQQSEAERARTAEQSGRDRGDWEGLLRKSEEHQAERDRLRTMLAESAALSQNLLKQQTEGFQQLLSETMARLHQDADTRMQLQTSQHAQERESLERTLHDAEARERKLAEQLAAARLELKEELRRLREAYDRFLDSGLLGLATTTPDDQLVRCNRVFAEFLGFEGPAAAIAQPRLWLERVRGDRGGVHELLRDAGCCRDVELQVLKPGGVVLRLVETAAVVSLHGEQSPVVEHAFLNVTDTWLLRDEQKRARRLQALVTLASSALDTLNELAGPVDSAEAFKSDYREALEAFLSKLPEAIGDAEEQLPQPPADQETSAETAPATNETD